MVTILIDGDEKFSRAITANQSNPEKIIFSHRLRFSESHELRIYRDNKTLDQCCSTLDGQLQDQLLIINGLSIDDIDVRHLIWCRSQFVPDYPEPWRSQQIEAGHVLEHTVIGESVLGHNGTWSLAFTSPFWQFLFDDMDK